MNLIESVLKAANAEKYVDNFRNENLDVRNLKVLNDEDLKLIGIEEEDVRIAIIKAASCLVIQSEEKINVDVDENYIETALLQISNQLKLYNASLYCAANRPDIINCDMHLSDGALSTIKAIENFKKDLLDFDSKLIKKKKNTRKPLYATCVCIGLLSIATIWLFNKN